MQRKPGTRKLHSPSLEQASRCCRRRKGWSQNHQGGLRKDRQCSRQPLDLCELFEGGLAAGLAAGLGAATDDEVDARLRKG
jgi:hypothetical protein